MGGRAILEAPVERIFWAPGRVVAVQAGGRLWRAEQFISSIVLADLIRALDPDPPRNLREKAVDFHHRDFLTVALMVEGRDLFPDQWIYVHEPALRVGGIQNDNNWSPEMSPDRARTCLGMEYFCSAGDPLWRMDDADLIELARRQLETLGLVPALRVSDSAVVRMQRAYPVCDGPYEAALQSVRDFLADVPNLRVLGRDGMHRYNNQDHSMLTGVLAARNVPGARYALWSVDVDEEYLEQGSAPDKENLLAGHPTG
ncbi:MAG: hypothetical protein RMI94_09485 [Bryobacterales bacterium]|nr:hypothetical protein [Bryobacteraceae bacterium]MDW8130766.1 hypothetical protein [Bryobacterales bacterium]